MLVHKGGKIKNWGGECRDVTPTKLESQISEEHCRCFTKNSNTPSLYTPMVKCSDILSDKSLGGLVWRYLAPFGRHFDFS